MNTSVSFKAQSRFTGEQVVSNYMFDRKLNPTATDYFTKALDDTFGLLKEKIADPKMFPAEDVVTFRVVNPTDNPENAAISVAYTDNSREDKPVRLTLEDIYTSGISLDTLGNMGQFPDIIAEALLSLTKKLAEITVKSNQNIDDADVPPPISDIFQKYNPPEYYMFEGLLE